MKDKAETKIKKIVLTIEGKELILSVEGAKELKTLLNDLFGREVVKEHHHHGYSRPYWYGYNASSGYLSLSDSNSTFAVGSKDHTSAQLTTSNDLSDVRAILMGEK